MPYRVIHHRNGSVSVVNRATGAVKARRTTAARAKRQLRLLRAVDHGWRPTRSVKQPPAFRNRRAGRWMFS